MLILIITIIIVIVSPEAAEHKRRCEQGVNKARQVRAGDGGVKVWRLAVITH